MRIPVTPPVHVCVPGTRLDPRAPARTPGDPAATFNLGLYLSYWLWTERDRFSRDRGAPADLAACGPGIARLACQCQGLRSAVLETVTGFD